MSILPFDVQDVLEGGTKKEAPSKVKVAPSDHPKIGTDESIKNRQRLLAKIKSQSKVKGELEEEDNEEQEKTKNEAEEEKHASFQDELRMRKMASFIKILHKLSGKVN